MLRLMMAGWKTTGARRIGRRAVAGVLAAGLLMAGAVQVQGQAVASQGKLGPAAPVTYDILQIAAPSCDNVHVVLTHQPVSETIDGWCRVGNLIAWVRLYPAGEVSASLNTTGTPPVPPTLDQAAATLGAAGAGLRGALEST